MKIEVTVTASRQIHTIPSASALEISDKRLFIAGDDSSEVVELDFDYNLLNRFKLFDSPVNVTARIPKMQKPDLECGLTLKIDEQEGILFLGSGSRSNREVGYFLPLTESSVVQTDSAQVKSFSLSALYQHIRTLPEFASIPKLNFEAAVKTEAHVVLMQRKLGLGENLVLFIEHKEFENFLLNSEHLPCSIQIATLQMPSFSGVVAGLSGAVLLPDLPLILASATYERTNDAVADGEILGSCLLLLPSNPTQIDFVSPVQPIALIDLVKDGMRLSIKVESIAVKGGSFKEGYRIVAVTDDDRGGSEILELLLKVSTNE